MTRLNATASTSTGPSVTSGAEPSASTGGAGRETAEELRARILAELEDERKRLDAEIAREKLLAEQALERDRARGLSGDQLQHVFASPAFADFLEQSTKVVQRALSDPYDYLRDYSISADDGADADESKRARVRLLGVWQDQQWGRGRSVTSVDWSPKVRISTEASSRKDFLTPTYGNSSPSSLSPPTTVNRCRLTSQTGLPPFGTCTCKIGQNTCSTHRYGQPSGGFRWTSYSLVGSRSPTSCL